MRDSFAFCRTTQLLNSIAATVVAIAASACSQHHPRAVSGPASAHAALDADDSPDTIRHTTADHATQLARALGKNSFAAKWHGDAPDNAPSEPRVKWISLTDAPAAPPTDKPSPPQPAANPKPTPVATQPAKADPQPRPQSTAPDRKALLQQLHDAIRSQNMPEIDKAVALAALSLSNQGRPLNPQDLAALPPEKQQAVRQYHKLLLALSKQIAENDGPLNPQAVTDQIQQLLGDQPIQIKNAALCRRVQGYGVYEPFDNPVFLAGREQPMIIYAELDNYRRVEIDSVYQVKLAQEVVLYNEADGLAVWHQPRVEIIDESRNRRRDFFVVQMVRLPARLGVGKYILKVRLTDQHSGSLDEATMPIQIVADEALVTNRPR